MADEFSKEELGQRFPIIVVPYDPCWIEQYEEEASFLRSAFGSDVIVHIEHFGSTAVPGLAAKPVIDILVEVTSFEIAERVIIPSLTPRGYGYGWQSGFPPGHMAFWKGYYPELPVQCHLHMAPGGHPLMDRLLFRDYLRKYPEIAKQYEELKYHLAGIHRNDREVYTEAKGDFVREITERAKKEFNRESAKGRKRERE